MAGNNTNDADLLEACRAFDSAYARYMSECVALADADASELSEANAQDSLPRPHSTDWRDLLHHLTAMPAHTEIGVTAKAFVVRFYFAENPVGDQYGMDLVHSLLCDIANVLTDVGARKRGADSKRTSKQLCCRGQYGGISTEKTP